MPSARVMFWRNTATVRRLKQESGAGLVNPIGPATITTRDIRRDRLRVYVDAGNVITAMRTIAADLGLEGNN